MRGLFLEAQDANGTRIELTETGLTYGEEFVAVDEMGGVQSLPHDIFGAGSDLSDLTVLRKNGSDLVIKDVPGQTSLQLSRGIATILREHYQ